MQLKRTGLNKARVCCSNYINVLSPIQSTIVATKYIVKYYIYTPVKRAFNIIQKCIIQKIIKMYLNIDTGTQQLYLGIDSRKKKVSRYKYLGTAQHCIHFANWDIHIWSGSITCEKDYIKSMHLSKLFLEQISFGSQIFPDTFVIKRRGTNETFTF